MVKYSYIFYLGKKESWETELITERKTAPDLLPLSIEKDVKKKFTHI